MPITAIRDLEDQIDANQHDIDSIACFMVEQKEGALSAMQVRSLTGLQNMYRQRILSQQAEIFELTPRLEACTALLAVAL